MKHMIYFIFLLLIIHNYTIRCLRNEKLIENILYGHSITDFSQLPLKNNKQTIPLCTVEPTIKNFSAYISSFNSTKVNVYHNGKCSYDFKLKHYYNNENLANIESIINENNYSFRDYYGNLIIVSLCNNEYIKGIKQCNEKIFYLSMTNFDFYQFTFQGEKFPQLSSFSINSDYSTNSSMIIINGGITQNGNYNSEYYKIELDYLTGIAHIGRVRNSFTNTIQGTIDNSITVVNYAKNNYIAISIGGINDQTISNKIYTLDINRNILKEINTKSCEIKPRKGHTATLIKKTNITAFENNIIQYYDIIIFGGKNEKETLNDIIIIKIAYMTIDNTFYYSSVDHIKSYGDIPEPREGHHAIYMNDALYIIGGCDYIKGICYNKDIYKLEIENEKFNWVKLNKEEKTIESNIANFMNGFVYFDRMRREYREIISEMNCKCDLELYGNKTDFDIDCSGNKHNGYKGLIESNDNTNKKKISLPKYAKINLKCKSIELSIKQKQKPKEIEVKKENKKVNETIEEDDDEGDIKTIINVIDDDDEEISKDNTTEIRNSRNNITKINSTAVEKEIKQEPKQNETQSSKIVNKTIIIDKGANKPKENKTIINKPNSNSTEINKTVTKKIITEKKQSKKNKTMIKGNTTIIKNTTTVNKTKIEKTKSIVDKKINVTKSNYTICKGRCHKPSQVISSISNITQINIYNTTSSYCKGRCKKTISNSTVLSELQSNMYCKGRCLKKNHRISESQTESVSSIQLQENVPKSNFVMNMIYSSILFIGVIVLIALFLLCNMNSIINSK